MAIFATMNSDPRVLNFILDTGSGGISLDSATREELSIDARKSDTIINGIAGIRKVDFAFNQSLVTDSLVTPKLDFYINDYALLTATYGEKIDGVIGYSWLSRYIIDIDFDSLVMRVYPSGPFTYPKEGTLLKPDFRRLMNQPAIVRDAGRAACDLYIDSGAGLNLLISEKLHADSAIISKKRRPVTVQAEGTGGKKFMQLTVLKSFRMGPYRFRNVPVHLFHDETNIFSYPYSGGLIGNDLLRRFNITLNYAAKEMHIRPNAHFDEPFDYAYSGMSLYMFNEKIYIDDIIAGSPADKAGLKNEDELLGVNTDFSGNVQAYKHALQKPNTDIRLFVKRNDQGGLYMIRPVSIK